MATKEEISMVGFEIVAYAGDAQTDLLAALDAAREGDFEKAEQLHKDASDALIGHVKDEFYRGREWETFEDFKRDLEEYIVHWNTSRRQVRLKGLTPEEFRNQALAA